MSTERQQERIADLCCRLGIGTEDAPTAALDRWLCGVGLAPVRWLPTAVARELTAMVEGWLCVIEDTGNERRHLPRRAPDRA